MSAPALLFDMDGTLIDSEPIWAERMAALAARHGAVWTAEDAAACTGGPAEVSAARMRARGVVVEPEALLAELGADVAAEVRARMPWLPGARELLAAVAERGLPAALVTNSDRRNASGVLDAAPEGALAFAVTGDEVARPKPHPEPYATALARLAEERGVARGIAFEDSLPGATAAHAAGLEVWFVRTHSEAPGFATRSIASLAEVELDALLATSAR